MKVKRLIEFHYRIRDRADDHLICTGESTHMASLKTCNLASCTRSWPYWPAQSPRVQPRFVATVVSLSAWASFWVGNCGEGCKADRRAK